MKYYNISNKYNLLYVFILIYIKVYIIIAMSRLISVWTQLIRNLLCVIKSLLFLYHPHAWIITTCIFPCIISTFNKESNQLSLFIYGHPLHLVTIVEFLICITQFLATIFCISDGFHSMKSFVVEYTIHRKLLSDLQRYNWSSNVTFQITGILRQYYRTQMNKSIIKGITSICLIVIGMSFVVLGCNNLHIHGAHHPRLVIEALILMEISLLFFLYLMLTSLFTHCTLLKRVFKFKQSIEVNMNDSDTLSNLLVLAIDLDYANQLGEVLVIASEEDVCAKLSTSSKDRRIHIERDIVVLQSLFENNKQFANVNKYNTSTSSSSSSAKTPRKRTSKTTKAIKADAEAALITTASASDVDSIRTTTVMYLKNNILSSIEKYINSHTKEIVLDIIYLVINFIAGYGYMMGILSYYFPSKNVLISERTTSITGKGEFK